MSFRFLAAAVLVGSVLSQAEPPSFEAATIKPSSGGAIGKMDGPISFKIDPGRLTYLNVNLRDCVKQAWNLKDYQVEGPKTMTSGRFNLTATTATAASESQMRLMLQALLMERFRMTVHTETRELPVYSLTMKNKGKLKESAENTEFAKGLDGGNLFYRHISMAQLAEVLSGFKSRPVLDDTGLTGFYDVTLDIYEDPAEMKKSMIRGDFGDVAAAAVESQLGLRMESRKSQIPMLIVDQAEKTPLEN